MGPKRTAVIHDHWFKKWRAALARLLQITTIVVMSADVAYGLLGGASAQALRSYKHCHEPIRAVPIIISNIPLNPANIVKADIKYQLSIVDNFPGDNGYKSLGILIAKNNKIDQRVQRAMLSPIEVGMNAVIIKALTDSASVGLIADFQIQRKINSEVLINPDNKTDNATLRRLR